jgi:hypothetical protein
VRILTCFPSVARELLADPYPTMKFPDVIRRVSIPHREFVSEVFIHACWLRFHPDSAFLRPEASPEEMGHQRKKAGTG